jgi:hypothetical protein
MQIVPFTLEKRMLFYVQNDVQIASRTAECARLAHPIETDSRAILHPGRHFGFDNTVAHQTAFAFALWARISDNAARSLAGWASASDAEEALLIADLSASIA